MANKQRALLWAPLEVLVYSTQFPVTPSFEFHACISREAMNLCIWCAGIAALGEMLDPEGWPTLQAMNDLRRSNGPVYWVCWDAWPGRLTHFAAYEWPWLCAALIRDTYIVTHLTMWLLSGPRRVYFLVFWETSWLLSAYPENNFSPELFMKPRPEFTNQKGMGPIIAGFWEMVKFSVQRLPAIRCPTFLYQGILGDQSWVSRSPSASRFSPHSWCWSKMWVLPVYPMPFFS